MTNRPARRIVAKWLAERGHVIPACLPFTDFASEVRRVSEGNAEAQPFKTKADAVCYIRLMAALIQAASDKPVLSWSAERARQDKRDGYRHLAKQRKARLDRLVSKMKREQQLEEDKVRYQERLQSEWPIVSRSRNSR